MLLGLNKIDLFKAKKQLLPVIDTYRRLLDFVEVVPISARTGENVDRLAELLVSHLPEGEPLYPEDFLTDQPERFFVSEMIRERILAKTREEIPYSTGVVSSPSRRRRGSCASRPPSSWSARTRRAS